MRPVIVSLYDESANMVIPWAIAGADCHVFDLLNWDGQKQNFGAGSVTWHNRNLLTPESHEFIKSLKPCVLFSFSPCTDLASSGARHFEAKFRANPRFQLDAMDLFMVAPNLADEIGIPYMCENPTGCIPSFYRKSDFMFNPYEYGGYLPQDDVHPRWPRYIAPRDAYPKETRVWCGNGFIKPEPKRVIVSPGYSDQYKLLGGKSLKTKRIRSETPRGYAIAVQQANWDSVIQRCNNEP